VIIARMLPTMTCARRSFRGRIGGLVALIAVAATMVGCGGSSSPPDGGTLRVLAASSLKEVFPKLAEAFSAANDGAEVEFSFAGSDELATQIREGAKADVYAAASAKYPAALAAEGEVDVPVPFTTNTLVLATPAGATSVPDLASLGRPGVKLVVGAAGVPVGDYTRKVLSALDASLGASWSADVMKNVVSEEQSVKGIVAKLQSGDADAGFVYVTDVRAAGDALAQIPIPADASPTATYPIAVVSRSDEKELAQRWIDFVRSAAGQTILADAGFGGAPPA
jgi:molybdate transport system substrate-binding protein